MEPTQRLMEAVRIGNIDTLIGLDPYLLEPIDQVQFADTPLHVAASRGLTSFAIEIMSLKPSLARKLNPEGFSPLDLALRNGYVDTVRKFVRYDCDLIRVQGKERITPLHYSKNR